MRLVFAGTPEVAVVSLEAVMNSRHEVLAVVTRPDATASPPAR
jgi:methionyl-tRNA formyltransferase